MNSLVSILPHILTPIILKIFQNVDEDKHLTTHSQASLILIPKLDKEITMKKKVQTNTHSEYSHKNLQQNTTKPNPAAYKKNYAP